MCSGQGAGGSAEQMPTSGAKALLDEDAIGTAEAVPFPIHDATACRLDDALWRQGPW